MKTLSESSEDSYNPEFIAKIKAVQVEEKSGKTTSIKTEDLWK